jgi:hypothetical protein
MHIPVELCVHSPEEYVRHAIAACRPLSAHSGSEKDALNDAVDALKRREDMDPAEVERMRADLKACLQGGPPKPPRSVTFADEARPQPAVSGEPSPMEAAAQPQLDVAGAPVKSKKRLYMIIAAAAAAFVLGIVLVLWLRRRKRAPAQYAAAQYAAAQYAAAPSAPLPARFDGGGGDAYAYDSGSRVLPPIRFPQ